VPPNQVNSSYPFFPDPDVGDDENSYFVRSIFLSNYLSTHETDAQLAILVGDL
jgi:hypothetical protein